MCLIIGIFAFDILQSQWLQPALVSAGGIANFGLKNELSMQSRVNYGEGKTFRELVLALVIFSEKSKTVSAHLSHNCLKQMLAFVIDYPLHRNLPNRENVLFR